MFQFLPDITMPKGASATIARVGLIVKKNEQKFFKQFNVLSIIEQTTQYFHTQVS